MYLFAFAMMFYVQKERVGAGSLWLFILVAQTSAVQGGTDGYMGGGFLGSKSMLACHHDCVDSLTCILLGQMCHSMHNTIIMELAQLTVVRILLL